MGWRNRKTQAGQYGWANRGVNSAAKTSDSPPRIARGSRPDRPRNILQIVRPRGEGVEGVFLTPGCGRPHHIGALLPSDVGGGPGSCAHSGGSSVASHTGAAAILTRKHRAIRREVSPDGRRREDDVNEKRLTRMAGVAAIAGIVLI